MYLLLKIAELIIQNIPRKAGYFVFDIFSVVSFYLAGKRKRTLKHNLENALGSGNVTGAMLKEVYRTYGRYYCDLFQRKEVLLKSMDESAHAIFMSRYYPVLEESLKNHRGFIVSSVHMGNWDFAGSYISSLFPGRVHIVVEKLSPAMHKWFTSTRNRLGVSIIDSTDIKTMIRVLKAGDALVLASDRDLDRNGFQLDFFGKKAYIPSGPAKLALMTGVPIIMGAMIRDEKDPLKFRTIVTGFLNTEPKERTKESVEELTKSVIMEMEKVVKMYPTQWCMLQQVFVDEKEK